jgi:hypothetical protein
VSKEVLAGPYAESFEGADVLAASLEYAHLKPSFKGYNDFVTVLQEELDTNVYGAPNETAREAIDKVLPELNSILAEQ